MEATSGFFETVASPEATTPNATAPFDVDADGDAMITEGRAASTTEATAKAHTVATATGMRTSRSAPGRFWRMSMRRKRQVPPRGNAVGSSPPLFSRPVRRIPPNIGHAAGTPVHAPAALHELFVDEIAPKGSEVRVTAPDDPVHIRLGVQDARLEILHEPAQDGQFLPVLNWDSSEPAGRDERLEDSSVVFGFFLTGVGLHQADILGMWVGSSVRSPGVCPTWLPA